jgi:hypothetical protein
VAARIGTAGWRVPVAAAILGLLAGAGVTATYFLDRINNQRNRLARLEQQLVNVEHTQQNVTTALTSGSLKWLGSPSVRIVSMRGTDDASKSRARLLWRPKAQKAHFVSASLPNRDEPERYALWFVTETGQYHRAGQFKVNGSGVASFDLTPPKMSPDPIRQVQIAPIMPTDAETEAPATRPQEALFAGAWTR